MLTYFKGAVSQIKGEIRLFVYMCFLVKLLTFIFLFQHSFFVLITMFSSNIHIFYQMKKKISKKVFPMVGLKPVTVSVIDVLRSQLFTD